MTTKLKIGQALLLIPFRQEGVPGPAHLRIDLGEPGACRRVRNADDVVAGRALNLPARILRLAFQRLVAMGTIKFEFRVTHKCLLSKSRQLSSQIYGRSSAENSIGHWLRFAATN